MYTIDNDYFGTWNRDKRKNSLAYLHECRINYETGTYHVSAADLNELIVQIIEREKIHTELSLIEDILET